MRQRPLWKLEVRINSEAEEAVCELLSLCLRQTATSYIEAATGKARVMAYVSKRPNQSLISKLRSGITQIRSCGLNTSPGRIVVIKVPAKDWAESWKRHFQPLEIGSALLLKPSWSKRRPKKAQAVVVLDPGLSFGTGQHPTTAFCLEQLVKRRIPGVAQSVFDIGTGSGILAIAAAKLGYSPIHACDADPQALRIARVNARQNGVARHIRFTHTDLRKLPLRATTRYSLICANLLADLLLAEQRRILAQLSENGILLLAGILKAEFVQVQKAYEAAGLRRIITQARNEWRSGAFAFRNADKLRKL